MLYTVIAAQSIWVNSLQTAESPMQPMQLGAAQVLIDREGVVNTVLSSDPNVFLQLNRRFPCGRMR